MVAPTNVTSQSPLYVYDKALDEWHQVTTAGFGPTGPSGPAGVDGIAGPTGPPGGAILAGYHHGGTQVHTGAVNVLTVLCEVTVHIKPDSLYEIGMGWRCIQDFGAAGLAQIECGINNVKLPTHTVISTGADDGLWGGMSRTWIRLGSAFSAVEADCQFVLRAMTSVADRVFYDPEIHLLELNAPSTGTGGGGGTVPDWVAVTPSAGISGTLKYRLSGGMVAIAYDITKASNFTQTEVIATLPAEACPPFDVIIGGENSTEGIGHGLRIRANGEMKIAEGGAAPGINGGGTYGAA